MEVLQGEVMYTPLDSQALYSTAFRTGALPWAIWTAILASMDADGNTSLNPAFLAAQWRIDEKEIEKAWNVHTKPDPKSKNKDYDGARLIPLDDGRWHVVSYKSYRNRYRKEIRAQQLREAQSRYRSKKKQEDVF